MIEEYVQQLKALLGDLAVIDIGGNDWVINISPSAYLQHNLRKLVGIQLRQNSTTISLPRKGFEACGVNLNDKFFGAEFREHKNSYMLLTVSSRLEPTDVAPVIAQWLNHYVEAKNDHNQNRLIIDSSLTPPSLFEASMNTIYYGPPGTGKTYIVSEKAASICKRKRDDYAELVEQGRIAFVTFHQSYSYEDFVEGIRPIINDKVGAVKYEIRQGIFRQMCDRAEEYPDNNYVLIIDEINRANISKVFGELITLLEPDKRLGETNEIKVRLPYSGDEFGIPSNLYLIGTMNTADRSIALLDTALRRRFEFEEMMPKPNDLPIKTIDAEDGKDPIDLVKLLESLNKHIEYLYDRDHTIGHAFFWNVETLDDLSTVFRRKVIPLLQEYFYEDWKKIAQVINDAGDGSAFLRVDELAPPRLAALDNGYGETRKRYSVKEQFTAGAFRNIYTD